MSLNDKQATNLEQWRKGDSLNNRAKLNQPVIAINRILNGIKPPKQINRNGDSTGGKAKSNVQQFIIVGIKEDYLECKRFSGGVPSPEDVTIFIQKPYLLRNSLVSRDGITYTSLGMDYRRADKDADSEEQVIVPNYLVDDIIYASNNVLGGVGNIEINWIDLNTDGRSWARKAD